MRLRRDQIAAPISLAQRGVAALLGAVALVLAGAAASAFLSSLYGSVAADVVRHSGGRSNGADAARLAIHLAPWRSAHHLELAQSLSAYGEVAAARKAGETAVRGNPADGYGWAYLARLSGAQPPLDEQVLRYYEMALSRSPDTPALHKAIALDGVLRWRFGSTALQALWRNSMAYTLARDRDRKPFLLEVVRMKRDLAFCAAHREHLPIGPWCAQVDRLRVDCAKPGLPAKAEAWCKTYGMTPLGR